ncbi:MAG: DUF5063 domain-containing protein [Bacteroidota bacterium]
MDDQSKNKVQSRTVLEMLTVANEYCLFIEDADKFTKEYMLSYLQKVLPLLYLKSSLLPDIEVDDTMPGERFVTEEEWEIAFQRIKSKLGVDDRYIYLARRSATETETRKGSLSENFTDIYQDMKDFILLYQKNTLSAQENAVHDCKLLFESHWGARALNALAAIHQILHQNWDDDNFTPFSAN